MMGVWPIVMCGRKWGQRFPDRIHCAEVQKLSMTPGKTSLSYSNGTSQSISCVRSLNILNKIYDNKFQRTCLLLPAWGQGRHFNFFLRGQKIFFFFNDTGILTNWKKTALLYM